MPDLGDSLDRWLAAEIRQSVGEPAAILVESIVNRHGKGVAAVLFYGSCLRQPELTGSQDSVHDFFVLVERYRDVFRNPMLSIANWLLPPNVFYVELPWRERKLRAKYAIVSMRQLRRRVQPRAFHPYFWARFAQPMRLAFSRNEAAAAATVGLLAQSVVTLLSRTLPLMAGSPSSQALWTRSFRETFQTELRAERPERAHLIYERDHARYDAITGPALRRLGMPAAGGGGDTGIEMPSSRWSRLWANQAWRLRRWIGKLLAVLRLIKGALTFEGAVPYILWKIERHSGVRAELTEWQAQHPVLSTPVVAWRLYRQGAFK
jgi:hypothetical protein